MTYVFEKKLATKFYTPGPRPDGIKYIVIHWWGDLGQSFNGVRDFLANPAKDREVSAHYVVQGADADGTPNPRVAQVVNDEDIAWQAGKWTANQESIGIECRPEAREEDYQVIAQLVRELRAKYGDLPLKRHGDIIADTCPGTYDLNKIDTISRKENTNMGSCARTTWRGVIVCAHSVPKYNAWAQSVGQGIMLTPLAGCGSYQTTTVASAGTHAGGGAIDIDLRYVASDKRKWVADQGRTAGLQVAWHRNYVAGLWTWHCHALDPHCPNLSAAAAAQVVEFGNGGDGLVGATPDANTRVNVPQIMALYATRFVTDIAQSVSNDSKIKGIQSAVRTTVDGFFGPATFTRVERVRAMAMYGKANFDRQGPSWRKDGQSFVGTTPDGVWGAATANAVKLTTVAIQKALGAYADGIWGPATDAVYQALKAACYKPAPAPKPAAPKPVDWSLPFVRTGPPNFFPYPGKVGASYYGPSTPNKPWYSGKVAGGNNDSVWVNGGLTLAAIQSRIKKIQKCVGTTQDGHYGAATVAAVKKWQAGHGLSADGIVGPTTWQAMARSVGN